MTDASSTTARCPVDHAPGVDHRRAVRPRRPGPAVERIEGGWIVRSAEVARQVLRDSDVARQAGFAAESVRGNLRGALPLLYNHGSAHRHQRSAVAGFFTPKAVDSRYRDLMARQVEHVVAELAGGGTVDMDGPILRYSVAVAREVVGLTESSVPGLAARLDRFFGHPAPPPGTWAARRYRVRSLVRVGMFHLWDVRPAVSARRAAPRSDVLSHLIEQGAKQNEILMEAVTYGAAGMVTTREFITVALWHLLDDADLRARYLAADQRERYAMLHELLRLEPVVGSLYRRLQQDLTVVHDGAEIRFAAGDLICLAVEETNVDETVVGGCPAALHPGRPLARGYKEDVLSFGDGPHRCPGLFLAIQESDMLLTTLLARPVELVSPPTTRIDPLIDAVTARGLRVRLAG